MQADYTGLGATAWDEYSRTDDLEAHLDRLYFQRIVEISGGPVLDVGCATGRILLPLCRTGVDIDGCDPTADVLAVCRERLATENLQAALYPQAMQHLDLPRRYQTILVPCGTIQLVVDEAEVTAALQRLHDHLLPGGLLLLALYNCWPDVSQPIDYDWQFRIRRPLPDGTEYDKYGRVVSLSLLTQTVQHEMRYRRLQGETVLAEEICTAPERFYFVPEMRLRLQAAGFTIEKITGNNTDNAASIDDFVYIFHARRL